MASCINDVPVNPRRQNLRFLDALEHEHASKTVTFLARAPDPDATESRSGTLVLGYVEIQ